MPYGVERRRGRVGDRRDGEAIERLDDLGVQAGDAAAEIATADGVRHLSMGGVDLRRDLNAGDGSLQTLYARSHLVLVSRAAALDPPIDSVYPHLGDDAGLREHAIFARSLGFFGKSAIHPRQLAAIHQVFTPSEDDVAWAREVQDACASSGGDALQLSSGEFVDAPVAERARRIVQLADAIQRRPT